MTKNNFVSLLFAVIGCMFLGLGMCMTMLPEWNAFNQGIVIGVIGIVLLIMIVLIRRKLADKPMININKKAIFTTLFGIVSILILGVAMCMIMEWGMLLPGIILGTVGIILLLCLIPIIKGFK